MSNTLKFSDGHVGAIARSVGGPGYGPWNICWPIRLTAYPLVPTWKVYFVDSKKFENKIFAVACDSYTSFRNVLKFWNANILNPDKHFTEA